MSSSNTNIAELQKEILDHLGIDPKNASFDFKSEDGGVENLNLITINPRHEQSFLFHSVKGLDKVEALEKMLEYVEQNFPEESTYTVQWTEIGKNNLETSYFRGKNVYEVLDKFYYKRDLTKYKIFSVALNPTS